MNRTVLALLALAAVLAAPLPTMAQAPAPAAGAPVAMTSAELRTRIQSDKKGIIQRNLPLTEAEARKFWPLYDAFEKDLAGPQSRTYSLSMKKIRFASSLPQKAPGTTGLNQRPV